MRSFFAKMFLLLVVSVSAGCVSSHYEGDSVAQRRYIGGFARSSSTPITIQLKNFVTGNWENYGTAAPDPDSFFWFTSYKLYTWGYNLPTSIASKYKSGNWIDMRVLQGTTILMTSERTEYSEDLLSISPESCVIAAYGPHHADPSWHYIDSEGDHHFQRQQPFLDCGLQTATGSDGVLRLRLN